MPKRKHILALGLLTILTLIYLAYYFFEPNIAVLNPKGTIADQQKELFITTVLLSLIIVIPVFVLTFVIAWKYRSSNKKAKYTAEWDHHKGLETLWWGIPIAIIMLLAVITWQSSHTLDPYKPIYAERKPMTVQVVALQWKWLFIYPEQNIASVNYLEIPENTPIHFEITADGPMNSLWIPQLGGQIYAMAGMKTRLHLMADGTGSYNGSSANFSGDGFSGMNFKTKSSSQADFDTWVREAKVSPNMLSIDEYEQLAVPSKNVVPSTYWSVEDGLYDKILRKYMAPKNNEGSNKSAENKSAEDKKHNE